MDRGGKEKLVSKRMEEKTKYATSNREPTRERGISLGEDGRLSACRASGDGVSEYIAAKRSSRLERPRSRARAYGVVRIS
jgi:hypothetical protein